VWNEQDASVKFINKLLAGKCIIHIANPIKPGNEIEFGGNAFNRVDTYEGLIDLVLL
jgi:hypothetical protein